MASKPARPFIVRADEARDMDAIFVDARWYLPTDGRSGAEEFFKGRLPGAVFFDIDRIAVTTADHPHRAPTKEQMAAFIDWAGISSARPVIVYDEDGFFSAPRVWFLLRAAGLENVYVLEGGIAGWRASGGSEIEGEAMTCPPILPEGGAPLPSVVGRDAIEAAIETGEMAIADARPSGRFAGEAPEPRPGLPSGHMPGALSLPASQLAADGKFLSPEALDEALRDAGLGSSQQVIATCGSGVTACVILLALAETGWDYGTWLYDGAWIDWAGNGGAIEPTPAQG